MLFVIMLITVNGHNAKGNPKLYIFNDAGFIK